MNEFFHPEKGIWAWLSAMVDVVGLSILWLMLCLPVVTIGPATAALYYTVVKYVRGREPGAFGGYLRSFAANFKVGSRATLLCCGAVAVLAGGYAVMRAATGTDTADLLFAVYHFALFLPAGFLCWLFPLLGRFTFGLKGLFVTAFQLSVRHLPSTVVVVLLTAETAAFCAANWWPALFMPTIAMLLASLFFERVFQKYAPELAGQDEEE